MSRLGPLKRQYRRRPVLAIASTVAGTEIVLGVLEGSFSLALLGIALGIGGGIWSWRVMAPSTPQATSIFLPYASAEMPVIQTETSSTTELQQDNHPDLMP
ncbi:hypothetical protein C7271_23545 [filamentous cyanobacterium CCP5]|nr:hypothetical protein C7271_23545 [filamentous cyanobacterium CCP5]